MTPKFKKITIDDQKELQQFIDELDTELKTFRYFNSRSSDSIQNHIYTCLLYIDKNIVGYGHLDQEKDKYWLGIVVKNKFQGQGLGKKIMNHLLNKADELNIDKLYLTCDLENIKAVALYKKIGFQKVNKDDKKITMLKTF